MATLSIRQGEFWTAKQRQMHALHYAISYRAAFKPEIPHYFINKFLKKPCGKINNNAIVLDPFGGRGTTLIEANMLGICGVYNDISRLGFFLAHARQKIESLPTLTSRLEALDLEASIEPSHQETKMLSPFYHPRTLRQLLNLRQQLLPIVQKPQSDPALARIGVAAISRLHGHSPGFFSAYSFPQISVLPRRQLVTNRRRGISIPPYRDVRECILKKLRKDCQKPLPVKYHRAALKNRYFCTDSRFLHKSLKQCVDLVITSPPFLNVVDYEQDNWLKHWFIGDYAHDRVSAFITSQPNAWSDFMSDTLISLARIVKPEGYCVIEVGDVQVRNNGEKSVLNLETLLISAIDQAHKKEDTLLWETQMLLINKQEFTKLANCWRVKNNLRGTNSNRCLILRRRL